VLHRCSIRAPIGCGLGCLIRGATLGVFLTLVSWSAAQDQETLGNAAEQAGNLREAFAHYVAALQSVPEGTNEDQHLRENIIALAQKLDPPPVVPEEAKRHAARGTAAIESAGSREDFEQAVAEFKQAAKLAPWWAKLYFNLGLTQEKATLYDDGIRSFQLFLAASPNDPSADDVRQRIYKLEYLSEHKQQEAARAQSERRAQDPKSLEGAWKNKETGLSYRVSITGDEFEARARRTSPDVVYHGDMVFHGVLRGRAIDGTFKSPAIDVEACTIPDFEMPMSGTVSEDRTSIIFHYQYIIYTYQSHWTIFGTKCYGVSRDHVDERVATLVR